MKGSSHPERIHIYITTFEESEGGRKPNMCDIGIEKKRAIDDCNKFICSVCLNNRHADDSEEETARLRTESCPVCRRHFDICQKHVTRKSANLKKNASERDHKNAHNVNKKSNTQATQTDITQGLSLLNEVLNVFQSNKSEEAKLVNRKPSLCKDKATVTERKERILTVCNLHQFSLTDDKSSLKNFVVLSSKSSEKPKVEPVISLIAQKSSSVPQMKIDEIKYSLKEKTKSKDAVDEVNRMFATVRKSDLDEALDNSNRPMCRNGPRVLPVAKTKKSDLHTKEMDRNCENLKNKCQCSHKSNIFYLSSGDGSPRKQKCCGWKVKNPNSSKLDQLQKGPKFICHCENANTGPFVHCAYYKTRVCCFECQERDVCSDASAGN